MTKKDFLSQCDFHVYSSWNGHKIRINAIYFDHKRGGSFEDNTYFQGYKYLVYANVKTMTKAALTKVLWEWVNKEVQPPYFVQYKYAETDAKRFKVPLSL